MKGLGKHNRPNPRRMRRPLILAVSAALGLICLGPTGAAATMTMRLSLAQIVGAADRAFVGRVESVHCGRDESGLPSTWIPFPVREPILGRVGSSVTIKQVGVSEPLADGTTFHLAGVPAYKTGEEVVLFLSGESQEEFSSPIALGQGKFRIVHRGGRALVSATVENAGTIGALHSAQRSVARQSVEADLDQFLSLVHSLVPASR